MSAERSLMPTTGRASETRVGTLSIDGNGIQVARGRRVPLLLDVRHGAPMSRQAREYFVREGASGALALAFLVESPMTRLTFSSYLRVQRPPVPSRVFTSEESALLWLRGLLP